MAVLQDLLTKDGKKLSNNYANTNFATPITIILSLMDSVVNSFNEMQMNNPITTCHKHR